MGATSHDTATAPPSTSFPREAVTGRVTRLTVYRIAHLRWDGTKWAFAGYHESRYYLTRRAAAVSYTHLTLPTILRV